MTQNHIPTNLNGESPDGLSGPILSEEALAASELRYRRLFETAKDGILILDAETGTVVDVNPFLINLLGFSREAFCQKKIWDLGFFKDIVANQDSFLELQQKGYVRYEDKALEASDGRRIEVEFVSNVYEVNHEKVIQCNIRDVSKRKQAEAALRSSRQLVEGILNAIPARIFWKDTNLRYMGCNTAFARDAGFAEPKDIIGKDDYQMGWHEQAELYRSMDRQVMESGFSKSLVEEPQTTPDGSIITRLTSKVPLHGPNGTITGVLGTYLDITERKRMEASNARLATAVEQSAETIVITDIDATILYVNPSFEKTTGYTREEALGQNPRILKSGKQDAEFYRQMWAVLVRGEVWNGHFINKRKDGTLYEEEATISPVRDVAGKVVNFVAVKRDVTHEVQLEHQLRQAQKMEAVGRLAGGVAHDFNNLLMGIMGYTELCRDQVDPDHPIREYLDEITSAVQRSAEITRQLLAFARKQSIAPRVLDLNDVVAGMLKLLRRLIGEGIDLRWIPGADLGMIKLDPSQVDQILANLCLNARDAITGVGSITMETGNVTVDADYCATHGEAAPGQYVCLTVSDNGSGMPSETLAHIFEPFFTTKAIGAGTGLGLATVYGIVRQNRGFIHVNSALGKGTTFEIYLPQVAAKTAEAPFISMTEVPKGRGETVLLVEDERSLRVTCGLFLEALGYKVLVADSPAEAIKLSEQYPDEIELLLTDVVMPGMDGHQLAIHFIAVRPGIKVLFMSGHTANVMAELGVLGTDMAFIAKPFMRNELALKVRDVLAARESGTIKTSTLTNSETEELE